MEPLSSTQFEEFRYPFPSFSSSDTQQSWDCKSMNVNEILTYYYGVCALVFQILHILEGEWDLSLFLFLLVWQLLNWNSINLPQPSTNCKDENRLFKFVPIQARHFPDRWRLNNDLHDIFLHFTVEYVITSFYAQNRSLHEVELKWTLSMDGGSNQLQSFDLMCGKFRSCNNLMELADDKDEIKILYLSAGECDTLWHCNNHSYWCAFYRSGRFWA